MLMIIMTKIDHKPFLDLIKKTKTKQYKKNYKKSYKSWPNKSWLTPARSGNWNNDENPFDERVLPSKPFPALSISQVILQEKTCLLIHVAPCNKNYNKAQ